MALVLAATTRSVRGCASLCVECLIERERLVLDIFPSQRYNLGLAPRKGVTALRVPPFFDTLQNGNLPCSADSLLSVCYVKINTSGSPHIRSTSKFYVMNNDVLVMINELEKAQEKAAEMGFDGVWFRLDDMINALKKAYKID